MTDKHMNTNWITIILLCLNFSTFGQTIEHEFRCGTNTYRFELPDDFKTSPSHYTEGDYNIFYRLGTTARADTPSLTLHRGSMVKLPHLADSTFIVERTSKFERSGTQMNGRFWKELELSKGINIFYQNATYEEKELFDKVIWKLQNKIPDLGLTNTIEYDQQNMHTYSVKVLLDSLSEANTGTFIIEGKPANTVHLRFLNYNLLNAEQERIFNHKSHLRKQFKDLVGEELIRLRLRSIYVEDSRIKLPIFIIKAVYSKRKKHKSEIYEDGLWTFIYSFNPSTNSFELESIEKGIIL